MAHIQGADRDPLTLFPEALDDSMSEENPVRFIDALVDSLDLHGLGFTYATPAETGRPAYPPGDLLRLYVYGYLNRVQSSRQLEKEANRNVELMCLLRRLAPDFRTIAFCCGLRLFGGEIIAIDGSKFKAVNARHRNFSAPKLNSQTEGIAAQIQQYLEELDKNDEQEAKLPAPTAEELTQKIEILRERKKKVRDIGKKMEQSGQTQVSLTDPDGRSMPAGKGHGTDVAYNVQVTADAKHKLILGHEVTNDPTDRNHLSSTAIRAKELLGVKRLVAVADIGCYVGEEVKVCAEAGINTYMPKPINSANRLAARFHQGGLLRRWSEGLLPVPRWTASDVPLPDAGVGPRRALLCPPCVRGADRKPAVATSLRRRMGLCSYRMHRVPRPSCPWSLVPAC